MSQQKGYLVIQNGPCFEGLFLGGQNRAGEVVFNTTHSGYEEVASDPSYFSQIVVMTAPMQGNYGVKKDRWESRQLWIQGFVCLEMCECPSTWQELLADSGIGTLAGIDTRQVVLFLRSAGTQWGAVVRADSESQARELAEILIVERKKIPVDWVYEVSRPTQNAEAGELSSGPSVAVIDFGSKENILREIRAASREIKIFNSRSSIADILKYNPDAVILTNGPGNPEDVQGASQVVKELIGFKPMMGICMGHQILSLAMGAKTYKLPFGHRGANHPIQDDLLNQVYMSSQNHGYAVLPETLPTDVLVTHRNLNDQSVAGIFSESRRVLGIQYHPESRPGPHEARQLFNYFFEKMI